MNTISSIHNSHAEQGSQPVRQTPATQQAQKSPQSGQDTVTLKSSGDADRDGDSK